MNKETEPQPILSIEKVASLASETLLRDGKYIPTIIAEGSRSGAVIQFSEFGDTFEKRQQQMTQTGYFLARDAKFGLLKQAFLISEGWLSVSDGDTPPTLPPSQDPNRKEVLTISGLQVEGLHVSMIIFEMIRNRQGQLTKVKPFAPAQDDGISAESPLLEALVLGFAMGLMDKAD